MKQNKIHCVRTRITPNTDTFHAMIIMTREKMYNMPHKLPNDLRIQNLRKLGNFKKILEMPGFDDEYLTSHQKTNFNICSEKPRKISST